MSKSNWFIMYTNVNSETELVSLIKEKMLQTDGLYEECFVLKYENVWKYQGKSLIDIENMFAGAVFVITDNSVGFEERLMKLSEAEKFFDEESYQNHQILYEMEKDEVEFVQSLLGKNAQGDYVVHRSFVRRENGKIAKAAGPLSLYMKNICLADYKHRRVVIERPLFGQVRRVKLCIMTEEDCVNEGRMVPEI